MVLLCILQIRNNCYLVYNNNQENQYNKTNKLIRNLVRNIKLQRTRINQRKKK